MAMAVTAAMAVMEAMPVTRVTAAMEGTEAMPAAPVMVTTGATVAMVIRIMCCRLCATRRATPTATPRAPTDMPRPIRATGQAITRPGAISATAATAVTAVTEATAATAATAAVTPASPGRVAPLWAATTVAAFDKRRITGRAGRRATRRGCDDERKRDDLETGFLRHQPPRPARGRGGTSGPARTSNFAARAGTDRPACVVERERGEAIDPGFRRGRDARGLAGLRAGAAPDRDLRQRRNAVVRAAHVCPARLCARPGQGARADASRMEEQAALRGGARGRHEGGRGIGRARDAGAGHGHPRRHDQR